MRRLHHRLLHTTLCLPAAGAFILPLRHTSSLPLTFFTECPSVWREQYTGAAPAAWPLFATKAAKVGASSVKPQAPLPSTSIALRHTKTGSMVYLLGVIHGAEASTEDVRTVLQGQKPDLVVLELCEARFQVLMKEREKEVARAQDKQHAVTGEAVPLKHLQSVMANLQELQRQYGPLQTALVALLSSSAEMQRFLVGDRSCEFRTSVDLAEKQRVKIVLGDQDLGVTMKRFDRGWDLSALHSLPNDLASIRDAVFGPFDLPWDRKINVPLVLFTQARYIREVLYVTVPVTLVVLASMEGVKLLTGGTFDAAMLLASLPLPQPTDSTALVADGATAASMLNTWSEVLYGLLHVCMIHYILLINRFILVERDQVLASAISKACTENPTADVAAVLGLLHCNGVSRHLRDMGFEAVAAPRS